MNSKVSEESLGRHETLRQTNHEDFKVFDNCLPFVQIVIYY